ncbi:MAG: hypothetical protein RR246_05420 [Clostridia bacterium]
MVERNQPNHGPCCSKPNEPLCCVSVNKIFDSARDKDCLEDLRVYLCDCYQDVIERASAIRCKNIEVVDTNISLEAIPFNKGYYQVLVRYYFCVTLECCLCNGRSQDVKGLCAYDKKIILFGSEKNVSVYTSDPENNSFCPDSHISCTPESTLPTVVVEVAPPICLDTKIVERCRPFGHCCMPIEAIPDRVREHFEGNFIDGMGSHHVYITVGMFSVIRMERSVQLMLPACNFSLPEKESTPCGRADPCSTFSKMNFPITEFYPYAE